jgi:cysteine desulfurase
MQVYMDYNASTPVAPEVAAAMQEFLSDHWGNPSCSHWAGKPAREAVEAARAQVAKLLGCRPAEIVFTSGGSEANNHAIIGTFLALRDRGNHIITTRLEHPAVIEPCRYLERTFGAKITSVEVDGAGRVDPAAIRAAITDQTVLISVMHANNEVGTIQPITEIAAIAHTRGVRFHTDAAQSVGKLSTRVDELGVDLLTIAGHKVYAPKGIGALYAREGRQLESLIHGAEHESGRRAGTESALLTVALGRACELAGEHLDDDRVRHLRDAFWQQLREAFGDRVILNGHSEHRLPNTLNVNFAGATGAELLAAMPEVAASTGSACHAGQVTLSPVLAAMGVDPEIGRGAIRFSLGRGTTREEIAHVLARLRNVV